MQYSSLKYKNYVKLARNFNRLEKISSTAPLPPRTTIFGKFTRRKIVFSKSGTMCLTTAINTYAFRDL